MDVKIEKSLLNKIQKLRIRNGTFVNISLIRKLFIENNKNLINISLEYINMTDIGFKGLLSCLIKNPNITNTLEYLSLEGNKITTVKYDEEESKNQNTYFQKLMTLNLAKNIIYKFEFFLNVLAKLKFLDLTSNNISTAFFMETAIAYKDKLILLNDNIFMTNNKNNTNTYIKYLNERFPHLDYEINNLNLINTYDIENITHFENLKLSKNVILSLIKLDLSFCALNTEVLIKFFINNQNFISLRNLNLRYNNIKIDFFEKIMSNEKICLDSINFIDLSENVIICDSLEQMENLAKFIQKYNRLKNMQLFNTGFLSDLINNKKFKKEKFQKVLLEFKQNLEDNKRDFKFITN